VFSRDLGAIGSQSDGTSYHSTALEQAPRFFQDPSGVPTQLDPAWLSVDSREQAPTFNQSYGGVTTQLQGEDQPSITLAQAPMFSQDIAVAASQSSPADYQQSFASGKGSGQAAMFSRDHDGVASHHNRINSLSTAPEHDPTYFPVSGVILTQHMLLYGYCNAGPGILTRSWCSQGRFAPPYLLSSQHRSSFSFLS